MGQKNEEGRILKDEVGFALFLRISALIIRHSSVPRRTARRSVPARGFRGCPPSCLFVAIFSSSLGVNHVPTGRKVIGHGATVVMV